MAIRPLDVRRKEFKGSFRGYDANEVDDFLDAVADAFERASSENQRLAEEVTSLRSRLEQFEELEDSIRAAIVHAEQVSRDLRHNANKEAELVVREAKERSHRILADSSSRVERVQESYEVLRQAKQEFSNDFRNLLKSYLAVMDNVDVATAKEIEAALRGRLDLESVAAAHEAAETRGEMEEETGGSPEDQGTGPLSEAWETEGPVESTARREERREEDTGRIEAADEPTTAYYGVEATERREPEVEEPEVDPSSVESPDRQERAAEEAAEQPEGDTDAAEEVDREEPMPDREDRAYDEFFDRSSTEQPEDPGEERKIFRASRFLRRRG